LAGSFVVSILVAPHLGPVGFGAYMTTTSMATLALILGKFGVHTATSRLLSEDPANARRWFAAGMLLRALWTLPLALIGFALSPWIARALEGESLVAAFWWMAPIMIAASAHEMACESMVGLSRFASLFWFRLGSLLLRLLAVAWVRFYALGAAAFLAGHALSQAIPSLLVIWPMLLRLPQGQGAPPMRLAFRRTRELSLPLAFGSASFLIYAHTDRLMLAWLRDAAAVGQFGVARNVLDAALFPVFALTWSMRPVLVRARADVAMRRRLLGQGVRYSVLFSLGGGALALVFGPPLLRAIYGEQYVEAAKLFAWMIPTLVLRGLGTPIFPALIAADRQKDYARIMLLTAALNVVLNLALIPRYGAVGSILATAIALVPLTWQGWRWTLQAFGRPALRAQMPAMLASAATAATIWFGRNQLAPADAGTLRLLLGAGAGCGLALLPLWLGRRADSHL
jgi:O-antigen/teichoic acid export membrane protein